MGNTDRTFTGNFRMAKIKLSTRKRYRENLRLFLRLVRPLESQLTKFFAKQSRKAKFEYELDNLVGREYFEKFWREAYLILSKHQKTVIETMTDNTLKRTEMQKKADVPIDGDDGIFVPPTLVAKVGMRLLEDTPDVIVKYVSEETAQHVTYITETTKAKIQSTIGYSIAEGLSEIATAELISESTAFSSTRAKTIARTETHQAMNYGILQTAKSLKLDRPVKIWGSALDSRTRQWHADMNGKIVERDEDFMVLTPTRSGSIELPMATAGDDRGGASNVINCRCFVDVVDADMVEFIE